MPTMLGATVQLSPVLVWILQKPIPSATVATTMTGKLACIIATPDTMNEGKRNL